VSQSFETFPKKKGDLVKGLEENYWRWEKSRGGPKRKKTIKRNTAGVKGQNQNHQRREEGVDRDKLALGVDSGSCIGEIQGTSGQVGRNDKKRTSPARGGAI